MKKKTIALTLATLVGTSYVLNGTSNIVFAEEKVEVANEENRLDRTDESTLSEESSHTNTSKEEHLEEPSINPTEKKETERPSDSSNQENTNEEPKETSDKPEEKAKTLGTLDSLFGKFASDLKWGTNIPSTTSQVTQDDLDQITEFTTYDNKYISVKDVQNFHLLRNLEVLDLGHGFHFNDKAALDSFWENLAQLHNLRKFSLIQPDRTMTNYNELYIKIPYLPNLETLNLEWYSVMDTSQSFQVSNTKEYVDTGINATNLPSLKVLDLNSTILSDYSGLKGMSLVDLDISFSGIKDISFLEGIPTLEKLQVGSNQIEDFTVLNKLPNLKELGATKQKIYYVKDRVQKRVNHPRVSNLIGSDKLILPQQIVKPDGSSLVRSDFTTGTFNNGEDDDKFTLEDRNIVYAHNFNFNGLKKLNFWLGDYTPGFMAIPYQSPDPMKNAQVQFEFDSGIPQLTKASKISGSIQYEIEETNIIPPMNVNKVPIIHATDKVIQVGDTFNPLEGVTATDPEDGEIPLTEANVLKNTVDTSKPGTYEVTYKVTDKEGSSKTMTIHVAVNPKMDIVNSAPTIHAEDKVLYVGETFDPLAGVTATDPEDGEIPLTEANVLKNTVDTRKAGTYTVTYSVTDRTGITNVKTITVTVKEKPIQSPSKPVEKPNGSAHTGAATKVGLFASLAVVSSSLLGTLLVLKKRKQ